MTCVKGAHVCGPIGHPSATPPRVAICSRMFVDGPNERPSLAGGTSRGRALRRRVAGRAYHVCAANGRPVGGVEWPRGTRKTRRGSQEKRARGPWERGKRTHRNLPPPRRERKQRYDRRTWIALLSMVVAASAVLVVRNDSVGPHYHSIVLFFTIVRRRGVDRQTQRYARRRVKNATATRVRTSQATGVK